MTAVSSTEKLEAVSRRTERLFIPAVFVTNLGNNIQLIAASLLVFKTSNTAFAVSWVFIAVTAPQILLSWSFGRLSDRFDRRTLCIIADVAAASAAAALPLWLLLGKDPNFAVYLVTLLLSVTAALFIPASSALMKERIKPDHLGKFNANYEIASQAGFLLSTAVGGFAVQFLDFKTVFFFNALTFVGSAICFYSMGPKPAVTAEEVAAPAPAPAAGTLDHTLPAVRPVARLGMLYMIGTVVILVVNMVLLVLVVQRFKQGAGMLGLVDAAAGIGILIAAWHYKRLKDKIDYRLLIVIGYVGTGVVDILMPISVITLIPLILIGGYTFGLARLAARTTLMKIIDADKAGRVFGAVNAVGLGFGLIAAISLAMVTDTAGVVSSFVLLGLWGIIPTLIIAATLLKTRIDDPTIAQFNAKPSAVPAAEPALESQT